MAWIKLNQRAEAIPARRGSILDAALAAGVPFPHGCRSGECGACKCRLHSGEVSLDGYAPEALSEEERKAGIILACRARPRGDVQVAWLDETAVAGLHPVRQLTATVAKLETATHDIRRVRLEVDGEPLDFSAGQYARLTFPGCPPRSLSMANHPDDPTLEFHIRRLPGGRVSGHVHEALRVGDRVAVEGPHGTACLREPLGRPLLLVAGGAGLAPIKSLLLAATDQGAGCPPIHLYHGVRDERDLYDADAIAAAGPGRGLAYHPVLSAPSRPGPHRTGFVHEIVAQDLRALGAAAMAGFEVYLCGPPPMVAATRAAVLELGARPEQVHADAFHTEAAPDREVEPGPERQGLWQLLTPLSRLLGLPRLAQK